MLLYGEATLPQLILDFSTKTIMLSMVAFETCPDGPGDYSVSSYICFMNSLINNAEDVTILQSQETLANCLGSDENIADLFNGIAKYLAPDHRDYAKFKNAIKAHYKNKFKI